MRNKEILNHIKYITCMVISIIFLAGGCVEYDKYVEDRDMEEGKPYNQQQDSGSNKNSQKKTSPEDTQTPPKDKDINKEISKKEGAYENTDVDAREIAFKQMPFLDRYEELLKQRMENMEEIKSLNEKIKTDDQTIKELQAKLENVNIALQEEIGRSEELEHLNSKITEDLGKENSELKGKDQGYLNEIKELKVNLLKSEIDLTKAKQEVIREKTQYILDKKQLGIED